MLGLQRRLGRRRPGTTVAIAALLLGSLTYEAAPSGAAHPGDNGVIAFTRTEGGVADVWTAAPDGSEAAPLDLDRSSLNASQVTDQLLGLAGPSWAPDGRHLVIGLAYNCAYGPTCGAELAVVDTTEATGRQITCDGAVSAPGPLDECRSSQYGASVSPDGTTVAFASDAQATLEGDIVVPQGSLMSVPIDRRCRAEEGSEAITSCDGPARLLTNDAEAIYQVPAAWSPDGAWLVTVRTRSSPSISEDLVAVRTDGSGQFVTLLEGSAGPFVAPDWSPDGTTLVVTKPSGADPGLYTVAVDCEATACTTTGDPTLLVGGSIYRGVYSPDGSRIAVDYAAAPDGTGTDEIWTVAAAGGDAQQVTDHDDPGPADGGPSWQPIEPAVAPPVARDQTVTTAEDVAVAFTLDVTDASGETLTFDVGSPGHGTLSGTAPALTYTPDPDYTGSDAFTWSASSTAGSSAVATVSIVVAPTDDPPTVDDVTASVAPGGRVTIPLAGHDPEGAPLTYQLLTSPSVGRATLAGSTVEFTAPRKFTSATSFTYRASDGTSFSGAATVTVRPNAPPTATAQDLPVAPGASIPITLSGTDPDGDPLTFTVTHPPVLGTLTGTPPNLTYTAPNQTEVVDYFGFTVSDGQYTSEIATVDLCVLDGEIRCQVARRRKYR